MLNHTVRRMGVIGGILLCTTILVLVPGNLAAQEIFLSNNQSPTDLYEFDLESNEATFLKELATAPVIHAITLCPGVDSLYMIGQFSGLVGQVELTSGNYIESILGRLPDGIRVVQMGCTPDGAIFITNANTDELYFLNLATCDPSLTDTCSPTLVGVLESSPGAGDVDLEGADIQFTSTGVLYALTNGTGAPDERLLYQVDLSLGVPCPGSSCPTTLIGTVATGENNQGMTALPDGRMIIASNDDHIYEVDLDNASLTDLGALQDVDTQSELNIASGDLAARPGACLPAIDFQTDGLGFPMAPGQIIDDEFENLGISVTTTDPVNHPLMIFDSSNPTGGDSDLGTPNETFSGPGIGFGGESTQAGRNGLPRGNILIISEDGDSSDPDDFGVGGEIIFEFDPPVAFVTEVHILDIDGDESGGSVTAIGDQIMTRPMLTVGNNSFQVVPLGASNVTTLEIHLPSSGAVSGIVFCGPCGAVPELGPPTRLEK